jgi:hypothetical protein
MLVPSAAENLEVGLTSIHEPFKARGAVVTMLEKELSGAGAGAGAGACTSGPLSVWGFIFHRRLEGEGKQQQQQATKDGNDAGVNAAATMTTTTSSADNAAATAAGGGEEEEQERWCHYTMKQVPVVLGEPLTPSDMLEYALVLHANITSHAGRAALPTSLLQPPCVVRIAASKACHGAVKFGQPLSAQAAEHLVRALSHCAMPFNCAHGRPSVVPLVRIPVTHPSGTGSRKRQKLRLRVLK